MSNLFTPIHQADLSYYQDQPFSLDRINQSLDVFITGNNLINRWSALANNESCLFNIAETGFGTGLNFLLSWKLWEQYAPPQCKLNFISCEQHPLSLQDIKKSLSYWPDLEKYASQMLEIYPVLTPGNHQLCFAAGRVSLTLMLGDVLEHYEQLLLCSEPQLERMLRTIYIDAWYLDGFFSAKSKSTCSDALIKIIAMLSTKGTTLASSTAAANVQSSLSHYGFIVEKKKGLATKCPLISAYFNQLPPQRLERRHTPWHVSNASTHTNKSAIIIGAGLAGCFTAYALSKRAWNVTLIDECDGVGKGGSANQQAVLFPKLSAYRSPLTQFMLSGFLYATKIYQALLSQGSFGELKGSLLLAYNEREKTAQTGLGDWLAIYPELGRLVNSKQASELVGLPLDDPGLFIPCSGWINSPALCQFLVNSAGVSLIKSRSVRELLFKNDRWMVNDLETEVLILANGNKINSFKQTEHLPVKSLRGQMTAIAANERSAALQLPLCGEGHILPAVNGLHWLGATFELNKTHAQIKSKDDELNVAKLRRLTPDFLWSNEVVDHWSGIRASTPDYFPLVGKIVNADEFIRTFAGLGSNSKRWIAKPGPYYPGLYACAGFGSRGLTTIPLCAEWLASLINNEIGCLPRSLQQALAPARFLRKDIIRGCI